MPSISRYVVQELKKNAKLNASWTAVVVQRYRLAKGEYPEKLSQLVPHYLEMVPSDPFDGYEIRLCSQQNNVPSGARLAHFGVILHDITPTPARG